ncbi:MAG: fimbrial biogenesis chaperone [Turicibacter sp.]|uniref:fimbrial biogenesis chaperone n=1 Tax=Aeromonas TaxID=642 RepID=UPI002A75499B|nr:molecular chaperone [Aeromonas jandaei]
MIKKTIFVGILFLLNIFFVDIRAAIQIHGTRFIYNEADASAIVRITNEGNYASLVQTWIDAGDLLMQPGEDLLPISILPPMAKIEAKQGQLFKLIYTGIPLPKDRESIFWINVLDIPRKVLDEKSSNLVKVAVRSRMKIFYRPTGLMYTHQEAINKLRFNIDRKKNMLRIINDGAYHLTIESAKLDGSVLDIKSMISPFSQKEYNISGVAYPLNGAEHKVVLNIIGDYGQIISSSFSFKTVK